MTTPCGVLGIFTGSGYLDFNIFTNSILDLDIMTRTMANLPHLAIGGITAYLGFVLSKRYG